MIASVASIADLVELGVAHLQTGPFGSQLHSYDYVPNGVPVVPTEAIRERRIDREVCPQISLSKATDLSRHRLVAGDILFARRGVQATGHIGVVREAEEGFICGTGAIRLRIAATNEVVCSEYLSHLLADPTSIAWFKFHAIGATMPNLNEGIIRSFPLKLPSLEYQVEVAAFLSAVDDKMELNRRMNETLEAMAQAIFRDWFVDFGPVRRKLAGETDPVAIMGGITSDLARAAELAALFPTALGENDLPEAWTESTLGEKTMAVLGGTPSRKVAEYWDGSVPWINSGAVNEFRITKPSELITEQGLSKSAAKLLPRRTTVLAITGATLGQVSLTEIETSANQSVVGLVPKGSLPPEFVYLWVMETIDEIVARQTGGAQQHVNKGNVEEQRVLSPPKAVLDAWSEFVVPLFDRIASGCFESHALAETRDYLLPRLMSGRVRIGEIGREIAQ